MRPDDAGMLADLVTALAPRPARHAEAAALTARALAAPRANGASVRRALDAAWRGAAGALEQLGRAAEARVARDALGLVEAAKRGADEL